MNSRVPLLIFALVALAATGRSAAQQTKLWWHDAPDTPQRFAAGIVSTDAEESALNLTPDGSRIYFARSNVWFPASRIAAIFQADHTRGGFSVASPAAFSRGFSDVDPFVLRNGTAILFSSMRPAYGRPRKDFDLWIVKPTGGGFSPATNLGPTINSDADDLYPSVSNDGALYFGSERAGGLGGWDIYRARSNGKGGYLPAENIGGPINSSAWEYNPAIAPDGSFLIFTSLNRSGGKGQGDLWIAKRRSDGSFAAPEPIGGGVNTPAEDYHPTLSPDGHTLFFIRRDAANGQAADFFWVRLSAVTGD
jgi:Tol biopolymer transport system component